MKDTGDIVGKKNLYPIWCHHNTQLKGKVMQMSYCAVHAGTLTGAAVWGSLCSHEQEPALWILVPVYNVRCFWLSFRACGFALRQRGSMQMPFGTGCWASEYCLHMEIVWQPKPALGTYVSQKTPGRRQEEWGSQKQWHIWNCFFNTAAKRWG